MSASPRSAVLQGLPFSYSACDGFIRRGRVIAIDTATVTVRVPAVAQGSVVAVQRQDGSNAYAEVRAVLEDRAVCSALDSLAGIVVGAPVTAQQAQAGAYVGASLMGNTVDAWGRAAGEKRPCEVSRSKGVPLDERRAVTRLVRTGIAAIDGLCALGAGQRVALLSGAGVGKSTLLRQIANRIECDAYVFALIGERAREASEAIESLRLSPRWPRTTIVCATAAAPAHERLAAMRSAQAQAAWLSDRGADVLLCVDSLTRVANAWREIALAAGEPPAHRGHPASLSSVLAALVEGAGVRSRGSITGIYAVLVDGDDPFEPVSDVIRGMLDGHIVLSRRLADASCFPAIDVLRSCSRLMNRLAAAQHVRDATEMRRALATLEDSADLLAIGAYKRGEDRWLDAALEVRAEIEAWLFHSEPVDDDCVATMHSIATRLRAACGLMS